MALGFGFVAFLQGQTTRPTDAQRMAETAKEFGMTEQWIVSSAKSWAIQSWLTGT
jgi:hypothetical protein